MKERVTAVDMAAGRNSASAVEVAGPAEGGFLVAGCSHEEAARFRQAFGEAGITNPLHVVTDGEEAIAYLCADGVYTNRAEYPLPNVVLLDLNLPRKSGFEVLGWIRTQPVLNSVTVALLTAVNRSADADRARELGADYYLTKPQAFADLVEMTRCLHSWLGLNHLS